MKKGRLEAFSDGVIAIIITIMVLELKVPSGIHGGDLEALKPMLPIFLSYLLSFVNVGMYWNNHHHMFYLVENVTGGTLWANLNLLFWLSLMPFATAWMGDNHFSQWPVAGYGCLLIACAIAYIILARVLVSQCAKNSELAEALGNDWKGRVSILFYALGIGLSFVKPYLGFSVYVVVAAMWFIPDRRIERKVVGK